MLRADLIIPLAGIALPAFLVPTILIFRQAGKNREYQHAERMKALETGRSVPGESNAPQALVCIAVGAVVPVCAFLFTFLATLNQQSPWPEEIWVAPMAVSVCAIIAASWLARSLFRASKVSAQANTSLNGKPAFDPDAYDVVGTRG